MSEQRYPLTSEVFRKSEVKGPAARFFYAVWKSLRGLDLTGSIATEKFDIQIGIYATCTINGDKYTIFRVANSTDVAFTDFDWKAEAFNVSHGIAHQLMRDNFLTNYAFAIGEEE